MTVNICGIPYSVKYEDDSFNADANHFGQVNYLTAEITINKNASDEVKYETLCHEIIHAMLVHIGRNDLTNDEVFVQSLANAISQTFSAKMVNRPID